MSALLVAQSLGRRMGLGRKLWARRFSRASTAALAAARRIDPSDFDRLRGTNVARDEAPLQVVFRCAKRNDVRAAAPALREITSPAVAGMAQAALAEAHAGAGSRARRRRPSAGWPGAMETAGRMHDEVGRMRALVAIATVAVRGGDPALVAHAWE